MYKTNTKNNEANRLRATTFANLMGSNREKLTVYQKLFNILWAPIIFSWTVGVVQPYPSLSIDNKS